MRTFYRNPIFFQKIIIVVAPLLAFIILPINLAFSQCDPSAIDPCVIGKNSIIQASYHAQIIKTSNGYAITGEHFAPNGIDYQEVLSNIPSDDYPMPTGVFPVWGALGGRTQAVFVGSDSNIYAVGLENLLINNGTTSNNAWGETSLSLPPGIVVCDINKWEGTAGSGRSNGIATGEKDGFLAFSTGTGDLYITGNGASAIQLEASNSDWTKIDMPASIRVVDFAVGYRTLLIYGSDGNLYASGPSTYLGNGTSRDLTTITELVTQPNISSNGISQIEAGFNSYLVLDGDGTIHVLGQNVEGSLGIGDTENLSHWSKVGYDCGGDPLTDVASISTLSSHDNFSASSAILVDRTIRSWGTNDNQSITSGNDRIITCPIRPTGTNRNVTSISNGGHITPYVNNRVEICNIGHNRHGAFGDGNSDGEDFGEYTCIDIPGTPEVCGTQEADLDLLKTVSDTNPLVNDTIVFTITVRNNGPNASTGSTVRDQLNAGFEYSSDDANGAYNNVTGLWTVGPLAIGESTSLNLSVVVLAAGENFNYAQVVSDNEFDLDSTPGDNSIDQDDNDRITIIADPIAECSDIRIQLDANGNGSATVNDIFISNIRDCRHVDSLMIESDSPLTFDCLDIGTKEIVFSVIDQCENASTCTATIKVEPHSVNETILLCPGDSIFIDNNWIDSPSIHVDTFINAVGCDSIHITNIQYVEDPPIPEVNVDCEALEVVLSVDQQSVWMPTWDNGKTTYRTIYEPTTPQASLKLNTTPNCEEEYTIAIPPIPNLNDIPILKDTTIDENIPLSIPLDLNTEEWQISWSPPSIVTSDSSMLVTISPRESTDVTLLLEHISGCIYDSSFFVRVLLAPEDFYIPNVFSPNGDSNNDEWTVFHSPNIQITECKIFNRWGEIVYNAKTAQPKWNGTFNGIACAQGVYVYVIDYSNSTGTSKIKSGDLTLIK